MAAMNLKRLFGKRCQLHERSNLQVRCLRQSTLVYEQDKSHLGFGSHKYVVYQRAKNFMENLDDELLERKKNIEQLIKVLREENQMIPEEISDIHWWELLRQRPKKSPYMKYLKILKMRDNDIIRSRKRALERTRLLEENDAMCDHLYHQSPIRDQLVYLWKKNTAMMSEIPFVIDLDFQGLYANEEKRSVEDINRALRSNALHPEPLSIHLTSFRNNIRMTDFYNAESVYLACHFHEQHFVDLFPPEQLVYLSPNGQPLDNFDTNCIYIVGGVEDFHSRPRLSFAQAKKHGIRCASFPRDHFKHSNRDLPIHTTVNIVRSMYFYKSWEKASLDCLDHEDKRTSKVFNLLESNLKKRLTTNQ